METHHQTRIASNFFTYNEQCMYSIPLHMPISSTEYYVTILISCKEQRDCIVHYTLQIHLVPRDDGTLKKLSCFHSDPPLFERANAVHFIDLNIGIAFATSDAVNPCYDVTALDKSTRANAWRGHPRAMMVRPPHTAKVAPGLHRGGWGSKFL